jgi:hypothetical protein
MIAPSRSSMSRISPTRAGVSCRSDKRITPAPCASPPAPCNASVVESSGDLVARRWPSGAKPKWISRRDTEKAVGHHASGGDLGSAGSGSRKTAKTTPCKVEFRLARRCAEPIRRARLRSTPTPAAERHRPWRTASALHE